jgi:hypothetical protein
LDYCDNKTRGVGKRNDDESSKKEREKGLLAWSSDSDVRISAIQSIIYVVNDEDDPGEMRNAKCEMRNAKCEMRNTRGIRAHSGCQMLRVTRGIKIEEP